MAQRYSKDYAGEMFEDRHGKWVSYQDYQKLEWELQDLKDKANGLAWVAWEGGNCPVGQDLFVDVKFRSMGEEYYHLASWWDWSVSEGLDDPYDIVAYRICE